MTVSAWLSMPDYGLMRRVNRWRPPSWLRWWFIAATRAGDGWLWIVCGMLLLCRFDRMEQIAFLAAAAAASLGILVFWSVKKLVGRSRPCSFEPNCWFSIAPPDRFSFPSGHTITAFAVTVPIGLSFPSTVGPLLFLACNVALSRIILGMHFLSDVVAGALIGTTLGYGSYLLLVGLV
jgi:undecaprenyl-diphosphatase